MIIQVDLVLLRFQIGMGRKGHDIRTFSKKVEKRTVSNERYVTSV